MHGLLPREEQALRSDAIQTECQTGANTTHLRKITLVIVGKEQKDKDLQESLLKISLGITGQISRGAKGNRLH